MDKTSMQICIGGEAGQGLATIGQVLGKALVRKGYHVHVTQTYESRIRGGHNTFALRVGSLPVGAPTEKIDLLIALDAASLPLHADDMAPEALALSDDSIPAASSRHFRVPLAEVGKGVHQNTIMLGAVAALLGLEQKALAQVLAQSLGKLTDAVIQENETALAKAYNWMAAQKAVFPRMPAPSLAPNTNMLLHGNEAIALGAMAAGLKFCCFYPMSPGTSVPLTVAGAARRMGIVVEQVEDEIAAINMALGASFAGARAMTSTSGGGLALMSEGISLAGVTETPVVIVVAMRPGPATGLATRTEQADLDLAMYSGHGEFPRAILAPGSIQECFDLSRKAFDLAERYQGPVFILTDQYLADSYRESAPFAMDTPPAALPVNPPDDPAYERYVMNKDGISPRRFPGMGNALVVCDSHEHAADGHLTEDLPLRIKMQDKRMAKLDGMRAEAVAPTFSGPDAPETLLVCWGSTKGAVQEAAELLQKQGQSVGVCHFSQVYPLQDKQFLPRFAKAQQVVMVESNCTGQMAGLLRRETGFSVHRSVRRYDGLPITASYIITHLAASKA